MPSVLIGPYLLRNAPGRFRDILTEAGFEPIDPSGGPALSREELIPHLPQIDAMIAGGERMTPELFAMAPRCARSPAPASVTTSSTCPPPPSTGSRSPSPRAPTRRAWPSRRWRSCWHWRDGFPPTTG